MLNAREALNTLKEAALAATPGPWKMMENSDDSVVGVCSPWSNLVRPENTSGWGDYRGLHVCNITHQNDNPCVSKAQAVANMKFIALANPALITSLIEALEAAEALVEQGINECYPKFVAQRIIDRCQKAEAERDRLREHIESIENQPPIGFGLKGYASGKWDGVTFVSAHDAESYDDDALLPLYEHQALARQATSDISDDDLWHIAVTVCEITGGNLYGISQDECVTRLRASFVDPDTGRAMISALQDRTKSHDSAQGEQQ